VKSEELYRWTVAPQAGSLWPCTQLSGNMRALTGTPDTASISRSQLSALLELCRKASSGAALWIRQYRTLVIENGRRDLLPGDSRSESGSGATDRAESLLADLWPKGLVLVTLHGQP